jgi:hypothetical protein
MTWFEVAQQIEYCEPLSFMVTSSLAVGRTQEAHMAHTDGAVVIVSAETLSGREEDGAHSWVAAGVEVAVTEVEFTVL